MLAIRLTRMGAKKRPSYRIIVSEKRYKRDGAYIDRIGHYDPLTEPATVVVDREKFDYWVKNGAQPTDVVKRIVLGVKGTKKRKPKNAPEEEPAAAAPAAEAPAAVTAAEATEAPAEETAAPEAAAAETPAEETPAAEEEAK